MNVHPQVPAVGVHIQQLQAEMVEEVLVARHHLHLAVLGCTRVAIHVGHQ